MVEAACESPALRLIATPASPDCRACVVIPARDEVATLGAALRALAEQVDLRGRPLSRSSFEVIVLANNCRDGSAGLARRFGASEPTLALHVAEVEFPGDSAHAGTARRLLMDEACRRLLGVGRRRGVIASTDGDTRVAPRWLAATMAEVAAGADVVGGDVRTDRAGRLAMGRAARDAYLVDVVYRRLLDEMESLLDPDPADPWPRHHHHTGASLAVAVDAYRLVGGLPPLPSSEDLAFVAALRRADLTLRHSPRVRVVTSSRRSGRAVGGMADTLRRWSVAGTPIRVEHPGAAETRAVLRRKLRALWRGRRPGRASRPEPALARSLGLDGTTLAAMLGASPTFGLLAEAVGVEGRRAAPDPEDLIDGLEAIAILKTRLAVLRRRDPGPGSVPDLLEEVEPIGLFPPPAQVA